MSKTLPFVDRLAARGRTLQHFGQDKQALRIWNRLAGLSGPVAEEARTNQAELLVGRRQFAKARRLLSAALAQYPGNAHYHYLQGLAVHADGEGNADRALTHFRRAAHLDSEQPDYLCALGLLALDQGLTDEGLAALRCAQELDPDNPEVVEALADGLCAEGALDEARATLRAALFRNSRDGRFHKLWSDFQFGLLRTEQERIALARPVREKPVLLPFVRVVSPKAAPAVKSPPVRKDPPSRPRGPHFPTRSSRRKHA
jgi:tetratricopeptide (TPR) repeat protein